MNHPMRVVDLFCGCSGLGLGAVSAGMDISLSVDIDPVLTSSHAYNFPGKRLLLGDATTLGRGDLVTDDRQIDGVVGGPPCQGFSTIGKSDHGDPRRDFG